MACTEFMLERIAKTKALIVVYEDATTALATGGIQSYKLDTGQTVQQVTKMDVADLNKTLAGLYNRLVTLEARCSGNGTIIGRPGW